MLFDFGNLITLGIVVLVLLLFRLLDRGNRSVSNIRKHTEKCKEDLAIFIEQQTGIINDFKISFNVERKSAAELLRRLQTITKDELAQKVQALTLIDDRIRDYDSSLEELVQMTGRVQDNLSRIKDESAFVEGVAKRVGDIKDKVEIYDREIGSIEKSLKTIEARFEQENADALERAVEEAVDAARTAMSTLEANAEAIDNRISDQEERIKQTEEQFDKIVLQALDRAGSRASKAEEAALAKLRDQAQERLGLLKTNFEEKVKSVQDTIKIRITEIQDQLRANREEWKTETALVRQQKSEWDKDIREFTAFAKQQTHELGTAIQGKNEQIINAAQERLDDYRLAQEEQFKRLSGIADDTTRLETELRRSMQEAMNRVNGDFTLFGKEMQGVWENAAVEFNAKLQTLRTDLAGVDRELTGIKERSFENVSQKLKGFEDEFLADLSKRSAGIDVQLSAWQDSFDKKLVEIASDSELRQQDAESRIADEIKKTIAAQGEKIISDLERLKTETAAFEEGIREEMLGVDESRKSFSEQLERDLEELKNSAQNELNNKIGQYNLEVSDALRQSQRDLETQIHSFVTDSKERLDGMESRMREIDDAMEEARRRGHEMITENDERIAATKTSLEEIRREITAQAKLFDRTETLKTELTRHVEDMSGNIERLLQLKNEIAHFENQFIQIKRLEDDVNAKMTRFLSEKRRIEVMESDFNRLLQTSQSVEEKLAQVSNSDDILQTMQIQLRRLEDAIKETEEKYQRVERKSKTLQETNDGIDRNFKALQEDEESIKKLEDTLFSLKTSLEAVEKSVVTLSTENEKARDAAEKLSTLDETVKWMEKRIAEMNVARESLARLATELQNLDKDAQEQLNLTRSLLNREEGKLQGQAAGKGKGDDGAPPPRDRENIIRLKRQGWTIDEIARSLKISKGEVELILELGSKD
ncbi:MAG: hypothetical protein FWF55_08360 [Treponema sp.]|nr:hypothetical protein [Treponema sp.]